LNLKTLNAIGASISTPQHNSLHILAVGLGASIAIHIGVIAGIARVWQPSLEIDEPMEITLVESVTDRVLSLPKSPATTPQSKPVQAQLKPIAIKTQPIYPPAVTAIKTTPDSSHRSFFPAKVIVSKSTPSPTVIKPQPIVAQPSPKLAKPIESPVSTPIASTPFPTLANPIPIVKSTATLIAPTASKTNSSRLPVPTPVIKQIDSTPIFTEIEPAKITPPIRAIKPTPKSSPTVSPSAVIQASPTPTIQPNSISSAIITKTPELPAKIGSNPVKSKAIDRNTQPDLNDEIKSKPDRSSRPNIAPSSSSSPSQPALRSMDSTSTSPTASNNSSPPLDRTQSTKIDAKQSNSISTNVDATSAVDGNGNKVNGNGNNNSFGDGNSTTKANSSSSNNDSPNGKNLGANNGNINRQASSPQSSSGLKCIENCQLPQLQDLQDSDRGKDRIRIRIEVDPRGAIVNAEIATSSGNAQIDAVVLDGIKQIRLSPLGTTIKGIVRINIFL
jgi:TonB family protein